MKETLKGIRFGILCDQDYLHSWEREAVDRLLHRPDSSLDLLIRIDTTLEKSPPYNFSNHQLYKIYLKWVYNPFSLRKVSIADLMEKSPLLTCIAEEKADCSYHLSEADCDRIQTAQLDFILHFTRHPIRGRLLTICHFGVWAFQYGNQPSGQGKSIAFWELFNREPVTTVSLCQLSNSSEDVVLKEGFFQTKLYSHAGTIDSIHTECANWPVDRSRQLGQGHPMIRRRASGLPTAHKQLWPSDKQLLLFLGRMVKHKLQHIYETFLRADQWNIGVVNRPVTDFLYPDRLRGATVDAPLLPNRNVFYADCFARQEASGTVVYFELYDYRVRRGTISRLNYPWPATRAPTKVLEFPFHLSYPFLFGPYCLPEAWNSNSVRLYDLSKPVTNPEEGLVLLPGIPGIDSTLLVYENRYWLFYTRADRNDTLNLFISFADSLEGFWHEHPQNPVKSDIRSSRPAGPFFENEGRLYRPAQDCSRGYGCGITVNEVMELTPTAYSEKEVTYLTSLHPDYPNGIHTITAIDETHTLIDFKRHRFIPFATLLALWILISPLISPKNKR